VALGDMAEAAVTYRKNPAGFALAEIESDQAENGDGLAVQKDGTLRESYTYRATKSDIPGKMTGFMLACRYAKNYRDSLAVSKSSALLLMQLPVTTGGVCVSTSQKPVGNAARPLKSAICTGK
jgi:hypothetical protein